MYYTPFPCTAEVRTGLIVTSVVVFLNLIIVALRFTARIVAGSQLGWDDWLMLAALPQGMGIWVCQILWSTSGVGYTWDVASVNYRYIFTVGFALPPPSS